MGGRGGAPRHNLDTVVAQATARADAVAGLNATEQAVLDAYQQLRAQPRDLVSLTRLRAQLSGFTRQQVDNALENMLGRRGFNLIPQSNQKVLTPADRAASIMIGNEPKLLLSVDM